jgi:cellulose synthase/poly-beta-1,6-N-acetylglucosamine synthase-like glycosyltransferase
MFNKLLSHKNLCVIMMGLIGFYIYSYVLLGQVGLDRSLRLDYFLLIPFIFLIDGFKLLMESFFVKTITVDPSSFDNISVIVPCYNGEDTLGPVVESLIRRLPKDRIIISLNACTDNSYIIAKQYGVVVISDPNPLGKEGAIQAGIKHVKTKYVITMDDDTLIGDAKIPLKLLEEGYSGVGFRVLPYKTNWLTTLQSHEYKKSMDIGRGFMNNQACVTCISGAIGLYRTDEVANQELSHTREFAGEDFQRTMLFHKDNQGKGTIVIDEDVFTDAPSTIVELFHQRVFGWNTAIYGQIRLSLAVLWNNPKLSLKFDLLYNLIIVVIGDFFRLLSLPILILYPYYFVIMYVTYVLLETVVWLKIKDRESYWVVLVIPFYGLFGFLTRVCSFAIWAYRRANKYILGSNNYDVWRVAPKGVKMLSYVVSVSTMIGLFVMLSAIKLKIK